MEDDQNSKTFESCILKFFFFYKSIYSIETKGIRKTLEKEIKTHEKDEEFFSKIFYFSKRRKS